MSHSTLHPTRRFSSRVENYVRYRPRYPSAVIDLLRQGCGLTAGSVVADIGSGTGILTELLLRNGHGVFGVEPNPEMRAAGERLLKSYPSFHSVCGTAESTTLKSQSMDLITTGQAFHWFEPEPTRKEFLRILKPGGYVVLLWNDRDTTSLPFSRDYEILVKTFGTDYETVNHKQIDATRISDFFGPGGFKLATFPNRQTVDWEGLKGRLMSSSYAPEPGHPGHEPMLTALRFLYDAHQANGTVAFDYTTTVYYGPLTS